MEGIVGLGCLELIFLGFYAVKQFPIIKND
jgi:hypothetical protein